MTEQIKTQEVIDEIKNATEDTLKSTIEKWYESTRTDGMKIGAKLIAFAVLDAFKKHINKPKPSLRDYERCIKDIRKIIAVQVAQQKDDNGNVKNNEVVEEVQDDGATE